MNNKTHPRLLFGRNGIEQLKQRLEKRDWLQILWAKKLGALEDVLKKSVELPERGGGWWHWYASPTTGAPLKTGKQIGKWEWEHIDPVSGEVFTSDRNHPSTDYDLCVLMGVHDGWSRNVRDLGLAYQMTGEEKYAIKAREIVMAYVAAYSTYELHTTRGEAKIGGGRVGPQTLDESVWLIPFCQGIDLVWNRLTDADQKALIDGLLQVSARDVILPHEMKVHNIQCWKNSAVGLVGLLVDDQELIDQAIHHPVRGYHTQLRDGVTADGQWWEGAWGYHFYTLSALWPLVEAGRNCGIDLYGDAFKRMFDAPLFFAMPDLRLPAFNDSGEVDLKGRTSIYEIAQARYDNPEYGRLLGQMDREGDFALWFGDEPVSAGQSRSWISVNYPASGYGVLSQGKGDEATWVCLKYGPHGGGHGHPDKLNFVLYAHRDVLGIDPGTARYGLPSQRGWYKTSLAHNTLVVDETSQEPAEGKCLSFGQDRGVDYCVADAGAIYAGVRFVRTVALVNAELIVVIDQVLCDTARLLDIVYHHKGEWQNLPTENRWISPDLDGYRYFEEGTVRTTSENLILPMNTGQVVLGGGENTDVITATGMGHNQKDRVPVVVFRRRSQETAFVWAVNLNEKTPAFLLKHVTNKNGQALKQSQAVCVGISTRGHQQSMLVNLTGDAVLVDGVLHREIFQVF